MTLDIKPLDLFDAKLTLLQSLSTSPEIARHSTLEHGNNGTWREDCPSENYWYFSSNDGRYGAVVHWRTRKVVFYRKVTSANISTVS